jgi:hypothetical protein
VPVAKLIAAAALLVLAGGPREFGIGGGAILCVPEREIDADATPYATSSRHLRDDGPAFAFQFDADEVRRHVPAFSVDPHLADLRSARTLEGSLGFLESVDRHDERNLTCRHDVLRSGRYSGVELQMCSRVTVIDGFRVSYEVQERNASLIAELDRFLDTKIAEWRDNCHSTDRL